MFRKSLIFGLFMLFVVQIPALVLATGDPKDLEGEIQKIRKEIDQNKRQIRENNRQIQEKKQSKEVIRKHQQENRKLKRKIGNLHTRIYLLKQLIRKFRRLCRYRGCCGDGSPSKSCPPGWHKKCQRICMAKPPHPRSF